ncbi:hypothetical protein [Streptomyces sp. NPDC090025]|uniref:hypothetical protein n=1 Tax=Streptomyces sp. NPDC090025 TaxID=3365922 RepID=UPI0038355E57
MSTRARQTGETLSKLGPLKWFRLSADRHPLYGYYQVPYLGWRFETPTDENLRLIEQAVRSTPTSVEWGIDTSRRNWLLAPSTLLEGNHDDRAVGTFDERVNLAMRDQDFCVAALKDLDAIIRMLRSLIAAGGDGDHHLSHER